MCNSRWFLFVLSVNEAPIDLGDCAMKKQNEFLLVTRIGKKSLHRFWLQPDRNFDVFFSAFDEDVEEISGDGVFFEHRPGPKVAGYGDFLADHRDLWQKYKYICLLDEDLETSAYDLNGTFTKECRAKPKNISTITGLEKLPRPCLYFAAAMVRSTFRKFHRNDVSCLPY